MVTSRLILKMESEVENNDLGVLYEIITGVGKYKLLGPYMHTYPDNSLHDSCLELERRGKIKRHIDETDHVCWVDADF